MTVRLEMTLDEAKALTAILSSGISIGARAYLGLDKVAATLESGIGYYRLAPSPDEFIRGTPRVEADFVVHETIELTTINNNA